LFFNIHETEANGENRYLNIENAMFVKIRTSHFRYISDQASHFQPRLQSVRIEPGRPYQNEISSGPERKENHEIVD
jgi:hypothetical protein